MSIIIPIFIIIFSLFILVKLEIKRECNSCKIKDIYIYTSKFKKSYDFLYLSDYHNSKNVMCLNKVEKVLSENDGISCVVSGGDMITYSPKRKTGVLFNNFISLLEIIKKYHKKFYFGYGNHENRLKLIREKFQNDINDLEEYEVKIKKFDNVEVLDDDYDVLTKYIKIYEIRLDIEFYKKNLLHLNIKKRLTNDIIKNHVGVLDKKCYNIILCHNPEYAENLIEYGFDLVLSGHQHGGLIRLPFIGSLFSPEATILPPYSKGLYKYKTKYILVSSGMGEHTIKIRLNNIPEIYNVHIVGE